MTGKPVLLFRADGDAHRGLGHVYRSSALAAMLRLEYEVRLLSASLSLPRSAAPLRVFDAVEELPGETDELLLIRLSEQTPAAVVLDGYHFGPELQAAIRSAGIPVICIDDIYAAPFHADLVVNHAPIPALEERYDVVGDGAIAAGLAYALLKPAFLEAARGQVPDPEQRRGFYLNFGGSDPLNVTSALIRRLAEDGYTEPLEVVLGPANEFVNAVRSAIRDYPGAVTVHENLDDRAMIELYRTVRLAFLPASTVLLEALATGVPVVSGYYVDNQEEVYRGYLESGLICGIGNWLSPEGLSGAIGEILGRPFHEHCTRVRAKIDGYSDINLKMLVRQVVNRQVPIAVRPMAAADAATLFAWANDPRARATAIDPAPIAWETHLSWFTRRLADPATLLLHFSMGGVGCGQVRFEGNAASEAIVSISVAPEFRGKGLAKRLLALAEEQLRSRSVNYSTLVAYVRPDNVASQKLFIRSGYLRAGRESLRGTLLDRFTKASG